MVSGNNPHARSNIEPRQLLYPGQPISSPIHWADVVVPTWIYVDEHEFDGPGDDIKYVFQLEVNRNPDTMDIIDMILDGTDREHNYAWTFVAPTGEFPSNGIDADQFKTPGFMNFATLLQTPNVIGAVHICLDHAKHLAWHCEVYSISIYHHVEDPRVDIYSLAIEFMSRFDIENLDD